MRRILLIVALLGLLAMTAVGLAYGQSGDQPAPVDEPTSTPTATATPSPTATPYPGTGAVSRHSDSGCTIVHSTYQLRQRLIQHTHPDTPHPADVRANFFEADGSTPKEWAYTMPYPDPKEPRTRPFTGSGESGWNNYRQTYDQLAQFHLIDVYIHIPGTNERALVTPDRRNSGITFLSSVRPDLHPGYTLMYVPSFTTRPYETHKVACWFMEFGPDQGRE